MKRNLFFLFISCALFISCHAPSYVFSRNSNHFGIEFREGKWLLNEIDAPLTIKDKLTEIALDGFSEHLSEDLKYAPNVHGLLMQKEIPLNPNTEELKLLKTGTGFDYFINIKAKNRRNDMGDFQIGSVDGLKKNVGTVTMEIYDLNTFNIIYKQTVRGVISVKNDSKDFAFAKSSNNLIIGGFKRIMKKIRKQQ